MILKLSELMSFFGDNRSVDLLKSHIKENNLNVDKIDFKGVTILSDTHLNLYKMFKEIKVQPVNLSSKDINELKLLETKNNFDIKFSDMAKLKKELPPMFKKNNYYVLVDVANKEKDKLAYVKDINERGYLLRIFYRGSLSSDSRLGKKAYEDNLVTFGQEITWLEFSQGLYILRNLNKDESIYLSTILRD